MSRWTRRARAATSALERADLALGVGPGGAGLGLAAPAPRCGHRRRRRAWLRPRRRPGSLRPPRGLRRAGGGFGARRASFRGLASTLPRARRRRRPRPSSGRVFASSTQAVRRLVAGGEAGDVLGQFRQRRPPVPRGRGAASARRPRPLPRARLVMPLAGRGDLCRLGVETRRASRPASRFRRLLAVERRGRSARSGRSARGSRPARGALLGLVERLPFDGRAAAGWRRRSASSSRRAGSASSASARRVVAARAMRSASAVRRSSFAAGQPRPPARASSGLVPAAVEQQRLRPAAAPRRSRGSGRPAGPAGRGWRSCWASCSITSSTRARFVSAPFSFSSASCRRW